MCGEWWAAFQVLDDGNAVQLVPLSRFGSAARQLIEPLRRPGLTPDQAEILAVVIAEGMATHSHIEDVRGFSQSRVGPEGVTASPRDCSETLALLVSRGLLAAELDDDRLAEAARYPGRNLTYYPRTRVIKKITGMRGAGASPRSDPPARSQPRVTDPVHLGCRGRRRGSKSQRRSAG